MYEHETDLHQAARTGNLKQVRQICTKHNIDLQDYYAYTPLMNAILEDHTDIFKFLLAHGANPDLRDAQGRTALAIAAEFGRPEYVELLLQASEDDTVPKKPDVNSTNASTRTPLMLAIDNYTWGPAIPKSFFKHPNNIDFAKTDRFSRTALYHAIEHGVDEALALHVKQHMEHATDIELNIPDDNGLTALHKAVEMRNLGAVEALVSIPGIDLAAEDKDGRTPYVIARQKGSRGQYYPDPATSPRALRSSSPISHREISADLPILASAAAPVSTNHDDPRPSSAQAPNKPCNPRPHPHLRLPMELQQDNARCDASP